MEKKKVKKKYMCSSLQQISNKLILIKIKNKYKKNKKYLQHVCE